MRRLDRCLIIVFSIVIFFISMLAFAELINPALSYAHVDVVISAGQSVAGRVIYISLSALLLISSILSILYAFLSGRLKRSRLISNETGDIDIGVEALQNIALNSMKAADVGVRNGKARVYQGKGRAIRVVVAVWLYADIEIPAQMGKIQERVKKDLEKYTGIPVEEVSVRVKRVEQVGARVED